MSWLDGPLLNHLVAAQAAAQAVPSDVAARERFMKAYQDLVRSDAVVSRAHKLARDVTRSGERADAPDFAQDALLKLLQMPCHGLLDTQNWAGFLSRVIRNHVLDRCRPLRRESRQREPDENQSFADGTPSADELLQARERHECVWLCWQLLSDRATQKRYAQAFSVVFELRDAHTENATLCAEYNRRYGESVTITTFEKLHSRAMNKLRQCVADCEQNGTAAAC